MSLRIEQLSQALSRVKLGIQPKTALVAVSKTYPASDILDVYGLNVRDFGENHVQELEQKSQDLAVLCPNIRWHMIGGLQSNKIRKLFAVKNLVSIHSVDRLSLVQALLDEEKHLEHELDLFLQVKTSDEVEKSGFETLEEVKEAIELLKSSKKLKVHGLMTMGKIRTNDQIGDAKICFSKLVHIRQKLHEAYPELALKLSMGMSGDFIVASLMGADYVRVGSLIFGARA